MPNLPDAVLLANPLLITTILSTRTVTALSILLTIRINTVSLGVKTSSCFVKNGTRVMACLISKIREINIVLTTPLSVNGLLLTVSLVRLCKTPATLLLNLKELFATKVRVKDSLVKETRTAVLMMIAVRNIAVLPKKTTYRAGWEFAVTTIKVAPLILTPTLLLY